MTEFYATVVIPTKNAMPLFAEVLDAVLEQVTPWPFDVIVIDSGSRDETIAYAEAKDRVRVIHVRSEDFGHGRTRNEAIASSAAPFVALLTHDAKPADKSWLFNLVNGVAASDQVAGAFGRHHAYPSATPFTKRDLQVHFEGFLAHPLIVSKRTNPERYTNDIGWRQFLHFYSDNNSCLRRSVWEQIPYPDVDFAEDQIWADAIIKAGWSKAYVPEAAVYHSHDYGIFERLQRSFDEAKNFEALFGYELQPSAFHALKVATWLSLNDRSYAQQSGINFSALARNWLLNYANLAGQYLGTHHRQLSDGLQLRLSRDKSIHRAPPIRASATIHPK